MHENRNQTLINVVTCKPKDASLQWHKIRTEESLQLQVKEKCQIKATLIEGKLQM